MCAVDNTEFQKRETYQSLRVERSEGTASDPEVKSRPSAKIFMASSHWASPGGTSYARLVDAVAA